MGKRHPDEFCPGRPGLDGFDLGNARQGLRAFRQGIRPSGSPPAHFPQDSDHPVVNVSRDDAQAFCDWLTLRERKGERISQSHVYRLPTDLEWSLMAGLEEDQGISPGLAGCPQTTGFPLGRGLAGCGKSRQFRRHGGGPHAGMSRANARSPDTMTAIPSPLPSGSFPANPARAL